MFRVQTYVYINRYSGTVQHVYQTRKYLRHLKSSWPVSNTRESYVLISARDSRGFLGIIFAYCIRNAGVVSKEVSQASHLLFELEDVKSKTNTDHT